MNNNSKEVDLEAELEEVYSLVKKAWLIRLLVKIPGEPTTKLTWPWDSLRHLFRIGRMIKSPFLKILNKVIDKPMEGGEESDENGEVTKNSEWFAIFPTKTVVILLLGCILYFLGFGVAFWRGVTDSLYHFFCAYRSLLWGLLGIVYAFVCLHLIVEIRILDSIFLELGKSIKNKKRFVRILKDIGKDVHRPGWFSIWSVVWVSFVVGQRVYANLPSPIKALTAPEVTQYYWIDGYMLFIYTIVLIIMGFGTYEISSYFLKWVPKLDQLKVKENLSSLQRVRLLHDLAFYGSTMWFLGVMITTPVLTKAGPVGLGILITEIILGGMLFAAPLLRFRKPINSAKDKILNKLNKLRRRQYEKVKSSPNSEKSLRIICDLTKMIGELSKVKPLPYSVVGLGRVFITAILPAVSYFLIVYFWQT